MPEELDLQKELKWIKQNVKKARLRATSGIPKYTIMGASAQMGILLSLLYLMAPQAYLFIATLPLVMPFPINIAFIALGAIALGLIVMIRADKDNPQSQNIQLLLAMGFATFAPVLCLFVMSPLSLPAIFSIIVATVLSFVLIGGSERLIGQSTPTSFFQATVNEITEQLNDNGLSSNFKAMTLGESDNRELITQLNTELNGEKGEKLVHTYVIRRILALHDICEQYKTEPWASNQKISSENIQTLIEEGTAYYFMRMLVAQHLKEQDKQATVETLVTKDDISAIIESAKTEGVPSKMLQRWQQHVMQCIESTSMSVEDVFFLTEKAARDTYTTTFDNRLREKHINQEASQLTIILPTETESLDMSVDQCKLIDLPHFDSIKPLLVELTRTTFTVAQLGKQLALLEKIGSLSIQIPRPSSQKGKSVQEIKGYVPSPTASALITAIKQQINMAALKQYIDMENRTPHSTVLLHSTDIVHIMQSTLRIMQNEPDKETPLYGSRTLIAPPKKHTRIAPPKKQQEKTSEEKTPEEKISEEETPEKELSTITNNSH